VTTGKKSTLAGLAIIVTASLAAIGILADIIIRAAG
jgi:hypothetical protein